jgi:hypothetical protein
MRSANTSRARASQPVCLAHCRATCKPQSPIRVPTYIRKYPRTEACASVIPVIVLQLVYLDALPIWAVPRRHGHRAAVFCSLKAPQSLCNRSQLESESKGRLKGVVAKSARVATRLLPQLTVTPPAQGYQYRASRTKINLCRRTASRTYHNMRQRIKSLDFGGSDARRIGRYSRRSDTVLH